MTPVDLIRCIGLSHLLQPPLTLLLSTRSGVGLRAALVPKTALAREVLNNMATASIALPTLLGSLIAAYATEVQKPGAARALALLLCVFWCWRLYRQVFVLGPLWSAAGRVGSMLNPLLTLIFAIQGPGLGIVLLS